MKSTERFKNVIEKYLTNLAQTNEQFAVMYAKENKNINDCITYILNTVKASGSNGFAPNEIYGMALHYYDEDAITVGKPIECQVVINEPIVFTDEEKAEARKLAMEKLIEEEKQKLKKKPATTVPATNTSEKTENVPQGTLF